MNRMIIAAALAACATVFSPMSFAEESSAFVARFAALQDRAQSRAAEQAVANRRATESQPAHAKAVTES